LLFVNLLFVDLYINIISLKILPLKTIKTVLVFKVLFIYSKNCAKGRDFGWFGDLLIWFFTTKFTKNYTKFTKKKFPRLTTNH